MTKINCDIKEITISEELLGQRIKELAEQIDKDYEGKAPIVVGVLKGGFLFMSDLVRQLTVPVELDFLAISSYGNATTSNGIVRVRKELDLDIAGRDVIVVEDIIDSGLSLQYIKDYLWRFKPASVRTCVLLDKVEARKIEVNVEYVGFEIGDEFVVGYGLDFAERYRNLPYIGILKEECYT